MLNDTLSTYKKYEPLKSRLFYGKVVSNEDPKSIGRIKVHIPELLPFGNEQNDNEEDDVIGHYYLPWIYPLTPAGTGGGPLSSSFSVPEEDSNVICIFPYNSIYHGFYVWQTVDRNNRKIDFMSEYPDRYGESDSIENKRIVNKNERVKSIETRRSDGSLSIEDHKRSTDTFLDQFGSHVFIDRKNQRAIIEFAGQRLILDENGLTIDAKSINIIGKDGVTISSSKAAVISSPTVAVSGKLKTVK